jgi:hypothetical protein
MASSSRKKKLASNHLTFPSWNSGQREDLMIFFSLSLLTVHVRLFRMVFSRYICVEQRDLLSD